MGKETPKKKKEIKESVSRKIQKMRNIGKKGLGFKAKQKKEDHRKTTYKNVNKKMQEKIEQKEKERAIEFRGPVGEFKKIYEENPDYRIGSKLDGLKRKKLRKLINNE